MEPIEIGEFIKQYWGDQFSSPLEYEEGVSAHGSDNVVFSTADGDRYVFRIIYTHPDAIHNGSQLYEVLHEQGLPVPLPIKSDDGEYVIDAYDEEMDRLLGYAIHTFVEGDEEIDKTNLGSIIGKMAKALADLHQGLASIDLKALDLRGMENEELIVHSNNIEIGFSDVLLEVKPNHPLVQEMYTFWTDWKKELDLDQFSSGLIHGDMGPGANILIKDDKVSGIIDLIDIGFGYFMQDVASFVMYGGLHFEERSEWLDEFKQVYFDYGPMDEEEFELLPFFILWRFLIQALYFGWRLRIGYDQGVEDAGNEQGFNEALDSLAFWKDRYADLM